MTWWEPGKSYSGDEEVKASWRKRDSGGRRTSHEKVEHITIHPRPERTTAACAVLK